MLEKVSLKEIVDHAQQLQSQGHFDHAIHVMNQVIGQHPDNPYLIYVYATNMMHRGDFGIASVLLHNAVRVKPDFAEAYNNLAVCYRREYHIQWSRDSALKAAELREGWPDPYNNLAGTYINEGCPGQGIQHANKALELQKPDTKEYYKIQWNKALMLLELGRYREGFELYESGIHCGERPLRNYSEDESAPTPYLDNINRLNDKKTVVVYGEQGMGDEIVFLSCLQNIIDTGAEVILECHPRLVSLFHRAFPDIEIHNTRKRDMITWSLDRQIDYCVAVGSLPRLYLQNHESFEKLTYIKSESDIAARMRRDLHEDGRPVIGIAWAGGTKKTNNWYRSLDMEMVEMITKNPQYRFISLQYDNDGHMPGNVEPMWEICQHYNYDLTAALVDACDAVIAINTSVVHLAGSMGKRVFCLTPSKPAWRYGVSGKDMMFYPDVHQYRQNQDDWKGTIIGMLRDLDLWANLNYDVSREVVA